VDDGGGCVNHGTSGGNAKENAGSLANAKDCDECHEEDSGNDEE